MKAFLTGRIGNPLLGIAMTIAFFVLLDAILGPDDARGSAIMGAIAGTVGFGVAAVIRHALLSGKTLGKAGVSVASQKRGAREGRVLRTGKPGTQTSPQFPRPARPGSKRETGD